MHQAGSPTQQVPRLDEPSKRQPLVRDTEHDRRAADAVRETDHALVDATDAAMRHTDTDRDSDRRMQGREHVIRFPTASRRNEAERRQARDGFVVTQVITLPAAASRIDTSTLMRLVDDPEHAMPDLAVHERGPELHDNRCD